MHRAPRDGSLEEEQQEKKGWEQEVRARGAEKSDETKEEGRPMLGDKSRLTSRERSL